MEEIYKQRLLKLADFLDKLPPKRFNFSSWVGHSWEGKADLSCGTNACAMGWATTINEFRELGLRLIDSDSEPSFPAIVKNNRPAYLYDSHLDPELAAKEIFGLSSKDFIYLFIPSRDARDRLRGNASAKDVSNRIREYVNNR